MSQNSTRVEAPELSSPALESDCVQRIHHEVNIQNPNGRVITDYRRKRKGLFNQNYYSFIGQLNCRTLNSLAAKSELSLMALNYKISICAIQEHRIMHSDGDPPICSHVIGPYTLFTASAWKSSINATIGGVGILIKSALLSLIQSIDKISDRVVSVTFKGNPKTTIISCYAPHSGHTDLEVEEFFEPLSNHLTLIPQHSFVFVCGDFNAQLKGSFTYHSVNNRNGSYLQDFMNEFNLLASNTCFQKRKNSLWTWRSPTNHLSQIDYILCRKGWRNSIHDCQAHSSSDPIGSDHRIVVSKCKLSLRSTSKKSMKRLDWNLLSNPAIATAIDNEIQTKWNECASTDYKSFAEISISSCKNHLPIKKRYKESEPTTITNARRQVLNSGMRDLQRNQTNIRNVYDREEEKRISRILDQANKSESTDSLRNAWKLVKEIGGKKKAASVLIKSDDPKKSWKDHFESLLNNTPDNVDEVDVVINQIFEPNENIQTKDFTLEEAKKAVKQMKPGKAAGLDGLPLEFWKVESHLDRLLHFCNLTLNGERPPEWGLSSIVPVPKKGDLTKVDNYRGISLTQVAAKLYNRLILNRIRPEIDDKLRFNQNGFRPSRSTSSQVLALRRLVEEVNNHKVEAVLTFIDFKKAFDSVNRKTMFKILLAYGIPEKLVNAIKIMYTNNRAMVMTSEGETDFFEVVTGVLQGDPLAPYLFILVLDYALRTAVTANDGFTIEKRRSRRHQADNIADLDFADDIALLNETIAEAENLLHRLEKSTQSSGLFLNAKKTKYMHINPTTNDGIQSLDDVLIEKVEDFKYLGAYTNSNHDIEIRIAQAWSALNSLDKIWKSRVVPKVKMMLFKSTVESILLYSCESWSLTSTLSKKLDGVYTRMLRKVKNIQPTAHITNKALYGNLPKLSSLIQKRRLQLAGHVIRGNEPATKLLLWDPVHLKRKRGRPHKTLKKVIEEDTGLAKEEIVRLAKNRERWRDMVMSSLASG